MREKSPSKNLGSNGLDHSSDTLTKIAINLFSMAHKSFYQGF